MNSNAGKTAQVGMATAAGSGCLPMSLRRLAGGAAVTAAGASSCVAVAPRKASPAAMALRGESVPAHLALKRASMAARQTGSCVDTTAAAAELLVAHGIRRLGAAAMVFDRCACDTASWYPAGIDSPGPGPVDEPSGTLVVGCRPRSRRRRA